MGAIFVAEQHIEHLTHILFRRKQPAQSGNSNDDNGQCSV
jgi:hypothetical protein